MFLCISRIADRKIMIGFLLMLLICLPSVTMAAAKFEINKDSWVSVGAGLRASGTFTENAAPSGKDYSKHVGIDNARIYLNGQAIPGILGTLNTESQLTSDGTSTIKLLDAIARLEFWDGFKVWGGRLLVPSDRNTLDGPFYLLMGNFPGVVSNFPAKFSGRDDGAAAWGEFFSGHLKYQGGVFEGTRGGSNQKDNLKYAGRLVFNLLDPEPGYYNSSTYFGDKKILALGLSGQFQKDAAGTQAAPKDFGGFETDVLFEYPLSYGVVTAEGGYYDYDYHNSSIDLDKQGKAFYGQTAFLFPEKIGIGQFQPAFRVQRFDSDKSGSDVTEYDFGLNYIIKGHDAKIYTAYSLKDPETGKHINQFLVGAQFQF